MSKKNKHRRQQQGKTKPKGAAGGSIPKHASGISKPSSRPRPHPLHGKRFGPLSKPLHPPPPSSSSSSQPKSSSTSQASQSGHSVPFTPSQKILLVGEGDFSFALSLQRTHRCGTGPGGLLVATTLETRASLLSKHPQAAGHVAALEAGGARIAYGVDGTCLLQRSGSGSGSAKGGNAALRRLAPFDRVAFNFPHVGGLTRDVNRQVRANQELCVGFLRRAVADGVLARGGRVAVSLFDGQPYELWGIRNLARHVGLCVVRSARFEWDRYPGYGHARTLGNLRGEGGWKGEERGARMYIFGRPGEEDESEGKKRKKRRKGGEESGSESEDSEVDEVVSDGAEEEDGDDDDDDDDDEGDDGNADSSKDEGNADARDQFEGVEDENGAKSGKGT